MESLTLAELLAQADSNETVGKMKVISVLESLPGFGKVKARRLMETVGISESRRLQGLGAKQREALLEETARRASDLRAHRPGRGRQGHGRRRLVAGDPALWLSRSWTTRRPRPGEREPRRLRASSIARRSRRPCPRAASSSGRRSSTISSARRSRTRPPGADVLLEIDVQGAEQVLAQRPDATVHHARCPPRRRSRRLGWRLEATTRTTSAAGSSSVGPRGTEAPRSPLTPW